jgi:hypothetical protein
LSLEPYSSGSPFWNAHDAEERFYWVVLISAAWSSLIAVALAALGRYSINRLLVVNCVLAAVAVLGSRGDLRLEGARRVGATALVPLALLVLCGYLFFPPAEYIVGGKDPGVYISEGVQLGQRGSLVTHDPLIAAVPAAVRDLFYPSYKNPAYYSIRFMGFFLLNPDTGTVVGQFPHLFPAWIAIGYGLGGLTGALHVLGCCAVAGVLGLYFLGSRLVGRTAAGAGAALLAISVVQVWFARYPNAEMITQALLLAGLLAFARAHVDDDPFFEPVAAVMLGLLLFARLDGALAVAAVLAAALLLRTGGVGLKAAFLAPLLLLGLLAFAYFVVVLWPYAVLPLGIVRHLTLLQALLVAGSAIVVAGIYLLAGIPALASWIRGNVPRGIALAMVAAACYAYFFRQPGGSLAFHDANSLRMFAWYIHPAGLAAALLGLVLTLWTRFWRDPGFLLAACAYALFVFYKIQIVPEHFWMARRFVPMIMPATMLFAATAILSGLTRQLLQRPARNTFIAAGDRFTRVGIRLVLLILLASNLLQTTRPILGHVEYAGIVPRIEQLATRFDDDDLVVVESRNASDLHVLALPLAYIYARNVLVLASPKPDKALFASFLDWARSRYRNVYFLGGGGTDLISRRIGVSVVGSDRFQVPEYESLRNAYPTRTRAKEFDFGIYRFTGPVAAQPVISIDIGTMDDLNVVRFHAKERNKERSFRWTRNQSYVSILGIQRTTSSLTVVMGNGGRPQTVPAATVAVFLDDYPLGSVTVGSSPKPYSFSIPSAIAEADAGKDEPALLRLVSSTWNPRGVLGVNDDRDLGVMVDRIDVR